MRFSARLITAALILLAFASVANAGRVVISPNGANANADAIATTATNAAAAAAAAQSDADDANDSLGQRFLIVQSASDPSGPCGYDPGENGMWIKTNATPGSAKFFICSDPAADEWAGVALSAP